MLTLNLKTHSFELITPRWRATLEGYHHPDHPGTLRIRMPPLREGDFIQIRLRNRPVAETLGPSDPACEEVTVNLRRLKSREFVALRLRGVNWSFEGYYRAGGRLRFDLPPGADIVRTRHDDQAERERTVPR